MLTQSSAQDFFCLCSDWNEFALVQTFAVKFFISLKQIWVEWWRRGDEKPMNQPTNSLKSRMVTMEDLDMDHLGSSCRTSLGDARQVLLEMCVDDPADVPSSLWLHDLVYQVWSNSPPTVADLMTRPQRWSSTNAPLAPEVHYFQWFKQVELWRLWCGDGVYKSNNKAPVWFDPAVLKSTKLRCWDETVRTCGLNWISALVLWDFLRHVNTLRSLHQC